MNLRIIVAGAIGIAIVTVLAISWLGKRDSHVADDSSHVPKYDGMAAEKAKNDEINSKIEAAASSTPEIEDVLSPAAKPNRLMQLRERAEAGEGLAQYEWSIELSACSRSMQSSTDLATITDKQSREFARMCRSLGKSSEEFRDDAEVWEERLEREEVPSAIAMKVIRELDPEADDEAISDARAKIIPLLASRDPYVYMAAGVLSDYEANPALNVAWHLLACENNNDSAVCSPHGIERWVLCIEGHGCDGTTVNDYYYIKSPEYYDEGVGLAMTLREILENGRYSELWD